MTEKVRSVWGRLVLIAYGFFILLGAIWFCTSWLSGHNFNPSALCVVGIYAFLAWYGNRIATLIAGVISLFFSFFMMMEVLNTFDLLSKNADFGSGAKILLALVFVSMVMSGLLIFSFMKLEGEVK